MKVKFIKNKIETDNKFVLNSNLSNYIELGSIYYVFGIEFQNEVTYLYIYDGNHLMPIPSSMVEIIDSKISNLWEAKTDIKGNFSFFPSLFFEDDFFELFSERDDKIRELFFEIQQNIEI